jgi:hypothetical protein
MSLTNLMLFANMIFIFVDSVRTYRYKQFSIVVGQQIATAYVLLSYIDVHMYIALLV